ncbi:MAG: MMPL family transporter [Actinobacteria bacterium]|nr:MMPL family transporter [Actinomycetota bacterium]
MKRFIHLLSSLVRGYPWAVLAGAVALTMVFGYFTQFQETASGNEGFAPDSKEFLAAQTIEEQFQENSTTFVQVVVSSEAGDVLTGEGVRVYVDAIDAVWASRAAEVLAAPSDVGGFLDPVVDQLEASGIDPRDATDEQVKQAYRDADPDALADFDALYSNRADLTVPSSPTGLMLVNMQYPEDDPDLTELQAIQVDMAEKVRAVAGEDVSADPFAFALLFEDEESFTQEIGRLFAAAGFIILIILASVFLLVPDRRRSVPVIAAGFAVMAITTALMVFEVVPIPAPLVAIAGVFTVWSFFHRKLRRAVADTMITIVVIFMSIAWMNGIGVLFGPGYLGIIGPFNEILQIIPILLIGLGVDYSIHLTSRYREEMAAGRDVADAAVTASRTVGVALVLATVTTAVGFLTNLFSPVTAIADFGVVATVGIGAAFVLMLTFVPALRIILDRRAEARGEHPIEDDHRPEARLLPKLMGGLSVLAQRFAVGTLALALVLGGLGVWGLTRLDTTFSFTDFVPQDAPLLDTFELLVDDFGGGFEGTDVLVEGDVATPEAHNALVLAYGAMQDTPDVRDRGGRPFADSTITVLYALAAPPEVGGNPFTYSADFAAEAADLGWAPDFSDPAQPDLFAPPDLDVAALYDLAGEYAPALMSSVVAKDGTGAYRWIDVSIATQAGEARAAELKDNLTEDFAVVNAVDGVTAVPTNENIISNGVVKALQSSQASSLGLTLVAAMALLVANFLITARRPFLGVITIVPVVLVVFWVFGAMAVTGISFNPVTAMIAAVAIGIGVPYTIHITHRYQEDRVRTDSPEEAIEHTLTHTGGALAGSALTTVAGFGILVTSTLKPFQQFGLVVGYAIGFALAAAVLVLPSMLVLWDRWHRRRGDAVMGGRDLGEAFAAPDGA